MSGNRNMSTRTKWWINGAIGAFLFGSGLALAIEASHWKHQQVDWTQWVFGGTAGIGLALSGVVLLVRAGILRTKMKKEEEPQ